MKRAALSLVLSFSTFACSSTEGMESQPETPSNAVTPQDTAAQEAEEMSLDESNNSPTQATESPLDATDEGAPVLTAEIEHHTIADGSVTIDGRKLMAGGVAFQIRGVCWNPVPKGATHPNGLDFTGSAKTDIPLMQAAGINTVRTYEPILDTTVLDALHAAGIKVIMSVYAWGGAEPSTALAAVNSVKNHPAILMWLVGNEWNYNGLYVGLSQQKSLDTVKRAAELIKEADSTHLVATVYGELPSAETITQLAVIDVWGINAYRGISFGDLFSVWETRSNLPMFLAEYGADAYDARAAGQENPQAQAKATAALATELEEAAARNGGIVSGGTIFEWSDEWWKDAAGTPEVQDVGGVAPGGGPYPDQTFNEEWWGIVTVERKLRPAYEELKDIFLTP